MLFFKKTTFFATFFYFVAMGRVELPNMPYESTVLPLDYIAYTPAVLFYNRPRETDNHSKYGVSLVLEDATLLLLSFSVLLLGTVVLILHCIYHSHPDHLFNKDLTSLLIGILLSFLFLSFLSRFLE